ncbi:UDP-galactopyranose mutase [Roseococcus sp. SYP-B2431]|uniref:UDP-galactopyranose mutase n=1 Tax=Roseococcus sp. SYP-B2431 TaxID=2496640 RepID=UPI00103EF5DA|nr:UDP-galactopyranose mutase [Roseococcus sp. SYP-B2431]TCH98315.1 UDP-galactopyranose mutase [Roseococcus sp. SYP-B2431]
MAMDGTNGAGVGMGRRPPLVCFSHLRWNSVFQRPQHLLSRLAARREVFFFEEPIWSGEERLQAETCPATGVQVLTPLLRDPGDLDALRRMVDGLVARLGTASAWYYTPLARAFSDHVPWRAIAYDCMDELAAFRFAASDMKAREQRLMADADVVFTGGLGLFEARRGQHSNIHCFPSGVDLDHFMAARSGLAEPEDQAHLPRPLLGYFGVIDERLDMGLLARMAELRPGWHFAMLGPVAKLAPEELPQAPNIHWLGGKPYAELPRYLAHWDAALMPFALNEATRFISPTKAPEYLAGGCRVISTPVSDVVRRFEGIEAVAIAEDAEGFVAAAELAMARGDSSDFAAVDDLLADSSWDAIAARMSTLLEAEEHGQVLALPTLHARPAPLADHLVVGAGFAGAVMAERLASSGSKVLVVDKRPHIAGNAYDEYDAAGLLIHRYGPHIFHTNSDEVLAYLSRFTPWRPYEHRVLAQVEAGLVPMPINRTTLNRVFGLALRTEEEARGFLETLARPMEDIRSAGDFVISSVGPLLYEMFFRGYTLKQWGVDPSELDRSVTARVPTRTCDDDRYFQDRHQCMPLNGYTRLFENMLDRDNITVMTSTSYKEVPAGRFGHMTFTGPVDEYFGHRFGPLPYRSLRFEHETLPVEFKQPVATINFPGLDTPFTRCTEFKHLTGQTHRHTSVCRETSSAEGDPYYPIPNPANQALFKRYEAAADAERGVTFLGRLGTYRYLNMDQVVGQALATARRMIDRPVAVAAD